MILKRRNISGRFLTSIKGKTKSKLNSLPSWNQLKYLKAGLQLFIAMTFISSLINGLDKEKLNSFKTQSTNTQNFLILPSFSKSIDTWKWLLEDPRTKSIYKTISLSNFLFTMPTGYYKRKNILKSLRFQPSLKAQILMQTMD